MSDLAGSKPTYRRCGRRVYAEWPTGHVYFATFEEPRDVVKVGWSQNPWYRTVDLGAMYGGKVRIIDTIEIRRGSKHWGVRYESLEQRIHRGLAQKRVHPWTLKFADRGEWYAMAVSDVPRLIETIERNIAREAT